MKKVMIAVYVIFILTLTFGLFRLTGTVKLSPGVKVENIPWQLNIDNPTPFEFKGFKFIPIAEFDLKGKILSKHRYFIGRETKLSDTDLAMGWGKMSDENIIKHFKITQGSRWYRWRSKNLPIPMSEVSSSSANMHLIPANNSVKSMIHNSKKGQIVNFTGYLVRVEYGKNWWWQSSTTRSDTGAHACEVVYVENFEIIEVK